MEVPDQRCTLGPQKPKNSLCSHCGMHFESRGMLFRHLRNESGAPPCVCKASFMPRPPALQRVAVLVGYHGNDREIGSILARTLAPIATAMKFEASGADNTTESALLAMPPTLPERYKGQYNITELDGIDPAPVCTSMESDPLNHVPGLTHGAGGAVCAPNAVADVFGLDLVALESSFRSRFVEMANAALPKGCVVHAVAEVSRDFNAEVAATLRHHQYLIPVSVLVQPNSKPPHPRESETDFRELLQRLKRILKEFEGWHCYHNFFGGTAQPHDSRSSVKRCSHFGQMRFSDEIFICINLMGTLRGEQVCRVVTVVVAVMRGYLPEEMLKFLLDDSGVLDVPTAPVHACVLAELHFSKYEVKTRTLLRARCQHESCKFDHVTGLGFDHQENLFQTCEDWRLRVMSQIARTEHAEQTLCNWADFELRTWSERAHQIFCQFRHLDMRVLSLPSISCEPPLAYAKVLSMLRSLDQDGTWPATTVGRKQVIREAPDVSNSGSFGAGTLPGNCDQPKANQAFPELVNALFELEHAISPSRPGSSTIAVNRRASFKPHKDSGIGAGQSRSLIVALGDFVGGELVVEGDIHDIHYKPLEFDGWGQRHWTAKFAGERFSLVYFTPHGCEDAGWLKHRGTTF